MNVADWGQILPTGTRAVVEYFNPAFGKTPVRGKDFLLVTFPNGIHLEIMWDRVQVKYVVVVTQDQFDTTLRETACNDAGAAVEAVKRLARFAEQESRSAGQQWNVKVYAASGTDVQTLFSYMKHARFGSGVTSDFNAPFNTINYQEV